MLVGGKILVSRHKRDNHNFIEYMSALMWYLVLAEVNLVLSNTKHTAILCMDGQACTCRRKVLSSRTSLRIITLNLIYMGQYLADWTSLTILVSFKM